MDEDKPRRRDPSEIWLMAALVAVTAAMLIACAIIAWMEISGRT